jgi:antitoxin MazE
LIGPCDYIIITPEGSTDMKLRLVAIGNSRGLRLPKAILEQCRLENEVELEIEAGRLIIKPARRSTRKGWDEAFKKMGSAGEDRLLIDDRLDLDSSDWEW